MALLGKQAYQVYAWLLPVVTAAFAGAALLVWKRGVRNYSSTGT